MRKRKKSVIRRSSLILFVTLLVQLFAGCQQMTANEGTRLSDQNPLIIETNSGGIMSYEVSEIGLYKSNAQDNTQQLSAIFTVRNIGEEDAPENIENFQLFNQESKTMSCAGDDITGNAPEYIGSMNTNKNVLSAGESSTVTVRWILSAQEVDDLTNDQLYLGYISDERAVAFLPIRIGEVE